VRSLVAVIALTLSACGGAAASVATEDARTSELPRVISSPPESATPAPRRTAGGPGAQAAAPTVVVAPQAADWVDGVLARQPGHAAVVVAAGGSGEILYAALPDEPVFAASLYKLAVLLETERRIDDDALRPADRITVTAADQAESGSFTAAGTVLTVDDALERMIVLSDNASALALIRRLGIASIQTTLDRERIALRFTADGAITTARGIATFFGELVRGSLVSREASARMLARLARQRSVDRLPAALPDGAVIAHKTGNLGFATHDAGIVRGPGGAPIVLVVLTWDSGEDEGVALIKKIAAIVYGGLARM
jgi:beta-lactamase class A